MGYNIGNQYALKLCTPELRKFAYKSYCDHLAKGKSKKSWNLKTPVKLTWESMEKYIRENEDDFDPIEKKLAESDGYGHWEQVVEDSAKGTNKDANTATLQMLMRNKYGWDKQDNRHNDESSATEQEYQKLMEQLNRYQQAVQSSAPV